MFQNCGQFSSNEFSISSNSIPSELNAQPDLNETDMVLDTEPSNDPPENDETEPTPIMEPGNEDNIPPIPPNSDSNPTQGATGTLAAVPGAVGGGKNITGGRGHEVVIVNTLSLKIDPNDNLTSFAEAVSQSNRTIVFNVAGIIGDNRTSFDLQKSNLTIACHTAPGNGIAFRFSRFVLNGAAANNIIMRHCRFRATDPADHGGDSDIGRAFMIGYGANNIYIDHMSASWGTDANLQLWMPKNNNPAIQNVSVVNSMIAEGDADSKHSQSKRFPFYHSMGASCLNASTTKRPNKITYANNFLAHNSARNYNANSCEIEMLNSVIYNWYATAVIYSNTVTTDVRYRNNLYVKGPNTAGATVPECGDLKYKCPYVVYKKNSLPINTSIKNQYFTTNINTQAELMTQHANNQLGTAPNFEWGAPSPIPITTMAKNGSQHMKCVGASSPTRDAVDKRLVNELYTGTGKVGIGTNGVRDYSFYTSSTRPNSFDTDSDGMSDEWERKNGLIVGKKDDSGDQDKDGYTNIEEYFSDLDTNCI